MRANHSTDCVTLSSLPIIGTLQPQTLLRARTCTLTHFRLWRMSIDLKIQY